MAYLLPDLDNGPTHVTNFHNRELIFSISLQIESLVCCFRNLLVSRASWWEHLSRVLRPTSLELGRLGSVAIEIGREIGF